MSGARATCLLALCLAFGLAAQPARAGAADEWPLHGRTADEQRFSPLSAIDRASVSRLGLAWSYDTGARRGMEATPIVVDGVLYGTASWSIVYALDAATGRLLWSYDPQVPKAKGRDACCDVVNRGVAVWQGRVYVGALDGRLIALDAATGKPLWQVQTVDTSKPYTITGAPRVVKGLGRDRERRRRVRRARLLRRLRRRRRARSSGASTRCPRARTARTSTPSSSSPRRPGPPTRSSSPGSAAPCGTRWPTTRSSICSTSAPATPPSTTAPSAAPAAATTSSSLRSWRCGPTRGASSGTTRRRRATHWDYTATQHIVLADLEIAGARRKVLMQAPKNGFFYVLDRATGELLSARNYVDVSWASHVDLATGRPVERAQASWSTESRMVTPSIIGGHNWHPMSYSPQTQLVYIPSITSAYPFVPDPAFRYRPGRTNTAESYPELARRTEGFEDAFRFCAPSHITAWDPVAARQVWRVESTSLLPARSALHRRRPGLPGAQRRRLQRLRRADGREAVGSADGRRHHGAADQLRGRRRAVRGGGGGGRRLARDGRDPTRIRERRSRARLEARRPRAAAADTSAAAPGRSTRRRSRRRAEDVARGRDLYAEHCLRCHGLGAKSSGMIPDLRYASPRGARELERHRARRHARRRRAWRASPISSRKRTRARSTPT